MMNWRVVLGITLAVAALITSWSAWRKPAGSPQGDVAETRSDYVLGDFEIISLDEQGKESITLQAPSLERSRADESMSVVQPVFLLPDDAGLHWQLRAQTGWISAKGDEMRLRGGVEGDSPKSEGIPPTTFRTDTLDVFPRTSQARTHDMVSMTRPGIIQTGVGFEADLKSKQYSLLSQVKTRYEPNAAR